MLVNVVSTLQQTHTHWWMGAAGL